MISYTRTEEGCWHTTLFAVLQVARFAEGSMLSYSLSGVHLESGLGPSLCISHWGTIAHSGGATDRMAGALQTMVELRRNRQGSYLQFVGLDSQSGAVAGPVSVDE